MISALTLLALMGATAYPIGLALLKTDNAPQDMAWCCIMGGFAMIILGFCVLPFPLGLMSLGSGLILGVGIATSGRQATGPLHEVGLGLVALGWILSAATLCRPIISRLVAAVVLLTLACRFIGQTRKLLRTLVLVRPEPPASAPPPP